MGRSLEKTSEEPYCSEEAAAAAAAAEAESEKYAVDSDYRS